MKRLRTVPFASKTFYLINTTSVGKIPIRSARTLGAIIGRMPRCTFSLALVLAVFATGAGAQTPQPFPKPGDPSRPQPAPPATRPVPPGARVLPPETPAPAVAQPAVTQAASTDPSEQTLGVPIYPGAQFVNSYDAGRGQRYYLFGTAADFTQIVTYYRTVLKQRGELVYELPPIHMFEVGRFREESMAFPPGVTVKDYTWGGSEGYINPKPAAQPARFRTIIQIVPAPAVAGAGR